MSGSDYVLGAGSTLLVVVGLGVIGHRLRRWLLPAWQGPVALLVDMVLAVSFLIVYSELLGTVGVFSRGPLVVGTVLVAAVLLVVIRRPVDVVRRPVGRFTLSGVAAAICCALVGAEALVAIRATSRTGVTFVDSLGYHLPTAAHFAVTHHTGTIVHLRPGAATPYYAFNDELMHAVGMSLLGRDSLTLVLGDLAIAATLFAAYCLGSAYGTGAAAVCAMSPIVALIGIHDSSAANDWASIWPLLAAVAIVAHARRTTTVIGSGIEPMLVAGLALGLAAGTKLDLLAPVAALLIGMTALARSHRVATFGVLLGGTALTCVYWFLRNIVDTGSPLPSTHLPGFPKVPMAIVDKYGFTVAHYLGDGRVVRDIFYPGLREGFGPAWAVLLALTLIGLLSAVLRPRDGLRIVIAVTALVGLGAYLVTPTTAIGLPGQPVLFPENLRYAWPGIVLALVALAVSPLGRTFSAVLSLGSLAILSVTVTSRLQWGESADRTIVLAVATALVVARVLTAAPLRRHGRLAVAVLAVAALGGGYPLQQNYLEHRYYQLDGSHNPFEAPVMAQRDVRIGLLGKALSYRFLGADFSNQVDYVGRVGADHSFTDYTDCTSLRGAVERGRYDYLVLRPDPFTPYADLLTWVRTDPAATEVSTSGAQHAFAIGPGFGAAPC